MAGLASVTAVQHVEVESILGIVYVQVLVHRLVMSIACFRMEVGTEVQQKNKPKDVTLICAQVNF